MKYFYEDAPEYYICAAGSLLGVAIHREHVSFPVGKVKTIQMYPMDFEEYLMTFQEEDLIDTIRSCVKNRELMPEVLENFVQTKSFLDAAVLQGEIRNNYIADMVKYATPGESVKIRACYDSIPAQLAKDNRKFQYKVVRKGGSAALFGVALDWLLGAGIIYKCFRVEQGSEPLEANKDLSCFKIYMADVGLLTSKSGISQSVILSQESNGFIGAITENYIATQLAAAGKKLYYWAMTDSQAELDFLTMGDGVYAIEVKAGNRVRSKSLHKFIKKFQPSRAIRFSTKNFSWEDGIDSFPLYAVFAI